MSVNTSHHSYVSSPYLTTPCSHERRVTFSKNQIKIAKKHENRIPLHERNQPRKTRRPKARYDAKTISKSELNARKSAWRHHKSLYPNKCEQQGVTPAKPNYRRAPHEACIRRLIVDSGASLHLIARKTLSKKEKSGIRESKRTITLQTANGIIQAMEEVDIIIHELGNLKVTAMVVEDTPSLISLGKLCQEEGYDYVWKAHTDNPYLQKENGTKVYCQVIQNVPIITPGIVEDHVPADSDRESHAGGDSKQNDKSVEDAARAEDSTGKAVSKGRPSAEHNLTTHFPKDPNCDICNQCKIQHQQCRKKTHGEPDDLPKPTKFADSITADHQILNEEQASRKGHRVSLIILDRYTHWLQGYAAKQKTAEETKRDFQRFLGPQVQPEHVFTDGSPEFKRALGDLGFSKDTSRPYRPQTNGVAERAGRKVKEGTSCLLLQSGFNAGWWPEAMTCFCFLRNVTEKLRDGFTPYENRFNMKFKGPIIPFGAEITYLPSAPKDEERREKYGAKTLSGIFVGYDQQAGGSWSGDFLVADWDDLESAENAASITLKRVGAKEVVCNKPFRFPLAEGICKQPETRTSEKHKARSRARKSRVWDDPPAAENCETPDGDPDGGDLVHGPKQQDFWKLTRDLLIRYHVNPRTTLYVPTDEDCPIPVKYLDVMRTTHTDVETPQSEVRIEDHWTEPDAQRALSSDWTGKTCFDLLRPKPPPGFSYVEGRLTRIQTTSRPDNVYPEFWRTMSRKMKGEAIRQWETISKAREAARKKRGNFHIPADELDLYHRKLAEVRNELSEPAAPAMPLGIELSDSEGEDPDFPPLVDSSESEGEQVSSDSDREQECSAHKELASASRGRPRAEHREKLGSAGSVSHDWFALVHTPIPLPEAKKIPEARDALEAEWQKLEKKNAWLLDTVAEYKDVANDAKAKGVTVHFGHLMALVHEKHSELKKTIREFKGRVVFRGDDVRDETGFYAVFSEQGTSASHLAAAKFLDAIARMPGHAGGDSDATGAYTQSVLKGPKTYITLPRDRWPAHWHGKYERPVVELRISLYGHPLAGLFWEEHSREAILKCGWEPVQGWECLYKHYELGLFLSVYVDDFKMAGKADNLAKAWGDLGKYLDIDPPCELHKNIYLGSAQRLIEPPLALIAEKREMYDNLFGVRAKSNAGGEGRPLQEDLSSTTTPSTERGVKRTLATPTGTPQNDDFSRNLSERRLFAINAWEYDMSGHAVQCVDRYLELAKCNRSSLKSAPTPCLDDHQLSPEDFENAGALASVCARIVLKALYLARMNRPDILWTVNILAREVTKWNKACDKRLHRLMCYLNGTSNMVLTCFVGDSPENCRAALFCDASFAGDLRDSKSTSGVFLAIVGQNTFVPITWICKKQGAVSHSSSEAEVISLDTGVRLEGIPALSLWDQVIEVFEGKKKNKANLKPGATRARGVTPVHETLANVDFVPPSLPPLTGKGSLIILEDNEAVIKMTVKGRSPNLRHVARTHRVDLDFLFDLFKKDHGITIRYVGTKSQIADILTKGQFTTVQWQVLSHLAQVCSPGKPLGETPSNKANEMQIVNKKKKKKAEGNNAKASHVSLVCPSVRSVVGQSPDSLINVVGHTLAPSNVTFVCPQSFSLQTSLSACALAPLLGSSSAMTTQFSGGGKAGKPGVTSGACLVSADARCKENTKQWLIGSALGTKALAELNGDMSQQVHAANVKWEEMPLQDALRFFSKALNTLQTAGHFDWTRKAEFTNFAEGDHCIHLHTLQTPCLTLSDLAAKGMQLFTVADSSYAMGKGTTKRTVLETAMNGLNDGRFSKIHVKINSGGTLPDLLGTIKDWVKVHAEDDPSRFYHHLVITTNLNDAFSHMKVKQLKHGAISETDRKNAEDFQDYISEMPYVIVIGPGNDDLWNAPMFLDYASPMMNIIKECGHPVYSGIPLFKSLDKSDQWHFSGNWENVKRLALGLYNTSVVLNHLTNLMVVVGDLKKNKANLVPASVSSSARSLDQNRPEDIKRKVTFAIQNEDRKNAEAFNTIASKANRWSEKDCSDQARGDPEQLEKERVDFICEMAGLPGPLIPGDIFKSPPKAKGTIDIPPAYEYDTPTLDHVIGKIGPVADIGPAIKVRYAEFGEERDPGIIIKCFQASLSTNKMVWIPAFRYSSEKGHRIDYARKVGHMKTSQEHHDESQVKEEQADSAGGDSGTAASPATMTPSTKLYRNTYTNQIVDERGVPYKGTVSAEEYKKFEPFISAKNTAQKGSTSLASAGGDSLPKPGTGGSKFSTELLEGLDKRGVDIYWSKSASFVLRHKRDRYGGKFFDEKTGWMKWEQFVHFFKKEAKKRLGVRNYVDLEDPHGVIQTLKDSSNWNRLEVQYLHSAAGDRTLHAIRAIQGHSTKKPIQELVERRVEITEKHAQVIYHGTTNTAALNIKVTGLIPGYGKEDGRPEVYFSLLHPNDPARPSAVGDRVRYEPYKFKSEALVAIDVKKARESGCSFAQTEGRAVLTSEAVPPSALIYAVNYRTGANIWSNGNATAEDEKDEEEDHPEKGAQDQARGDPGMDYDDSVPDFGEDKDEEISQAKPLKSRNKIEAKKPAGGDSSHPLPPPSGRKTKSDVSSNLSIRKPIPRCANTLRHAFPVGNNGRACTNTAAGSSGRWPEYCSDQCHELHLIAMDAEQKTLAEKFKEDPERRCPQCHSHNSAGTLFCKSCHKQLENKGMGEETQQRILDTHVNQASGDLGLEIVIKVARGGQSKIGALTKYCRKAVKRLAKISVKQRQAGTLEGPAYSTLVDRFERDPVWQAEMIGQGNDRVMIENWQRLAEQNVATVGMKREDREAAFGARAQVTSKNKDGGSGTVSVKNQDGYKRLAEECRDRNLPPPGKRGKGHDASSSAAGDRWQGDDKGGKGSKSSWGSSGTSSWGATPWHLGTRHSRW